MFSGKTLKYLVVLILFIASSVSMAPCAYSPVVPVGDRGEIKVHNGAKFPVEIYISDQNMGRLHSGDSNSWFVNYGTHRVEARWRGGKSCSTTLTVTNSNPYASWYISEEEAY